MGLILSDLSRKSEKIWKSERTLNNKKVPTDTGGYYYNLMSLKYPMTDEKIRSYFRKNASGYELKFNNLYLPPLENNILSDFETKQQASALYTLLFGLIISLSICNPSHF